MNLIYLLATESLPPNIGAGNDSAFMSKLVVTSIVLLFICLLAILILKLVYRGKIPGTAPLSRTPVLQVVAQMQLAPQKALHLVKVGEKYYLLGSSEKEINLLAELKSEELPAGLSQVESRNLAPVAAINWQTFLANFRQLRSWPAKKNPD